MAKVKNKRNSGVADRVHNKRKSVANKKKLNPFEVHINREKLRVLGQKSKHDRGLPGVSRAKAMQKRKETLGTEMKLMHKTNAFIDRRIGENNSQLTSEDRLIARFAAERAKKHSKKDIYNLADDEILTHRGQTLEQIEKFDDPKSSDEEDEDGRKYGGLDDDFVAEGHFGGGVLSKTDARDGAKSHKDLIEQLIAESKKRKAEKQKEKEQTLDLTEKLDGEWKDLQPVVFKRPRVEEKTEPSVIDKLLSGVEKKAEDYDKTMRELKFEKRGTPSDGLKNEQQLAKEERERIEKLEKEREERMKDTETVSVSVASISNKHRSADDLDDNFQLDTEPNFMLAYDKDGKPLVPHSILKQTSVGEKNTMLDGVSDSSTDDDEDDGDNDNEEEDDEDTKESNKEDEEEDDDTSDKESNKETDKDGKTGLFCGDNEGRNDEDEKEASDDTDDSEDDEFKGEEEAVDDLTDLKQSDVESEDEVQSEDVSKKIKSFFDLKSTEGDNLKELFSGKTPSQHSLVLQKLIKSYDPGLAENNKDNLTRLYAHLLQYLNDIFTNLKTEEEMKRSFQIFDKLAPYFYDLCRTGVVSTKKYLMEVLTEKHEEFKRNPKRIPDLDTLIFFKLVSLIYPTSDFKHPVVTPCFVFMTEILRKSHFRDVYSISRGIFLTCLLTEYTVLSKRYVPEMVNFLRGIFYLCSDTSVLKTLQLVPPFRLHKDKKILCLECDCRKMAPQDKMAARDLIADAADNDFKIRCLWICAKILKETFDNFTDLEAQSCIFEPHLNLLGRVNLEHYPEKVSGEISEILSSMKQCLKLKTFRPISREKKRPKALKMYEPDIQEVFTGSKTGKMSREMAERSKLKHKYKREMKGALREIRRDKAYVASVNIRNRIRSDNIRKEKVKQIYKDGSIQQGELNKLKRKK